MITQILLLILILPIFIFSIQEHNIEQSSAKYAVELLLENVDFQDRKLFMDSVICKISKPNFDISILDELSMEDLAYELAFVHDYFRSGRQFKKIEVVDVTYIDWQNYLDNSEEGIFMVVGQSLFNGFDYYTKIELIDKANFAPPWEMNIYTNGKGDFWHDLNMYDIISRTNVPNVLTPCSSDFWHQF